MTGPEAAALPLHEWEGFYVIVGTSAAALTGLMFVVIAVVADAGPRAATPRGIATFLTPTIVHFCLALVISAILSARWPRPFEVQIILALLGVGGLVYTLMVLRRAFGIHNAWDTVTYLIMQRMQGEQEKTGK